MSTEDNRPQEEPSAERSRFSELDELQREIALRIKDNEKFLQGFLLDDYNDEEDDETDDSADFEEL